MEQSQKDRGSIIALMEKLVEIDLPRARRLLDRVNAGLKLRETDIEFLKRLYEDSEMNEGLVERNPAYQAVFTRSFELYTEIIRKGLENEKTQEG
jgi:hypothetical protein